MSGINTGSSVVRWIENNSFFGRPRYDKRQLTCQQAEQLADYVLRASTCRVRAAYTCVTPEVGFTWTGDACVCSTFWGYASKFSKCWADTPYSACFNAAQDNANESSWSGDHCTARPTPTPSPSPSPSPTPAPNTPTPAPAPASPNPAPTTSREEPKPADPPKATDPGPSNNDKETITETQHDTKPTSAPPPSVVAVSVAPPASLDSADAPATTSPPQSALPRWMGSGPLLRGHCGTPEYTIIDGPTAYWAPVIGCAGANPDCCAFDISPSTISIVVAAVETTTASLGGGGLGAANSNGPSRGFPSAIVPSQATLSACPADYHSVGAGCCPSGYTPWSTAFGGQTPCYSSLYTATTPPPISAGEASNPSQPTSAIVNVVYAMQYPLKSSPSTSGLSLAAKIGIGAGAGVALLLFAILSFLLVRKHKAHKQDRKALEEMSGVGGSARMSVANSSAYGGVKAWSKDVSSVQVSSGLEPIQEPSALQVSEPGRVYRTSSPPVPYPGAYYQRSGMSSPPLPVEGYSEVGSEGSAGGYGGGRRSELQSGEFGVYRQEMQGAVYYEAPAGRMTPQMGARVPMGY